MMLNHVMNLLTKLMAALCVFALSAIARGQDTAPTPTATESAETANAPAAAQALSTLLPETPEQTESVPTAADHASADPVIAPAAATPVPASTLAQADETRPIVQASPAAPRAVCLSSTDGSSCALIAHSVQFFINVENGQARIFYQMPTQTAFRTVAVHEAQSDLDQEVAAGRMSPENEALIAADILSRSGASYQVPASLDELRPALGFAPDQPLAIEDQIALIQVHLQMTLGVSQPTAQYLARPFAFELVNR